MSKPRQVQLQFYEQKRIREQVRALGAVPMAQIHTQNHFQSYAYADTPEHREGIAEFIEKRRPAF